jgi:hypothetical protein
MTMRSVVTFKSDLFNLTEPKEHFMNPSCFGDDLAKWLIQRFKEKDIEVEEEPGQEDFGWYFHYLSEGTLHCLVIGNEGGEAWYLVVERHCGLLGSMFGQRHKKIVPAAIELVHTTLHEEPRITDVEWFHWRQFRRGQLTDGASVPTVA